MASEEILSKVLTNQPCLIVRVTDGDVIDGFLIIEKKLVGKISVEKAMLTLFASFYTFYVCYPPGCCNFYLLLECLILRKKLPGRKPRLAALMAELQPSKVELNTI